MRERSRMVMSVQPRIQGFFRRSALGPLSFATNAVSFLHVLRGLSLRAIAAAVIGCIGIPLGAAVGVTINPTTASLKTGASTTFSATVTGGSPTTKTWTVREGSTGGTVTSSGVYTAPGTAGTYHVVATSVADPSKSATATVTVTNSGIGVTVSPASAALTASTTKSFSATVTGTSTTTVTWSATGGTFSGSTYTAPATPGTYTVTAASTVDSTKKGTATVTVTAAPTITGVSVAPATASLSTAGTQAFAATVTGTGAFNSAVTWSATGGTFSGATYTAPTSAGTYTVTATSTQDSSKKGTATVSVQAVAVSISPTSATLAPGATQLFTAAVTGTTNLNTQWTCSGGTLTQSGDGMLFTAPAATGTYTITAASAADPSKKATATITVKKPTVSVSITPATMGLPYGATQPFVAAVSGSTNTVVTWSVVESRGGSIDANGVYTAPSVTGTYTVKAVSVADSTKSATAKVNVSSSPVRVFVSPSSITVTPGSKTLISYAVTGTTNPSIKWSYSGGSLTQTADGTLFTAPAATGTYTVTATSLADPSRSATATLAVIPGVSVTVSPTSAAVAMGGRQTFTASVMGSSNTSVLWAVMEPDGGSITATGVYTAPDRMGIYHVIATSVADSTKLDSATVEVSDPAQGITVLLSPPSLVMQTGETKRVGIHVLGTQAKGVDLSLDAGSISYSDTWVDYTAAYEGENLPGGHYNVTVTSKADPSKSASADIHVVNLPYAEIMAPGTVTSGDSLWRAELWNPNQADCTYLWSIVGGQIVEGQGTGVIQFKAASGPSLTLRCTVTNLVGTTQTGSLTLQVISPAVISAFSPLKSPITLGESTTLQATYTGVSGTIDHGVGVISSGGSVRVSPGVDTTYVLTVANGIGTLTTASCTVAVVGTLEISGTFKDAVDRTMVFYQNGTTVTGIYYDYPWETPSTIEATLNGYSLTGNIRHPFDPELYPLAGTFSADGQIFTKMTGYPFIKQPGISMRITPSDPSIHKAGDTVTYVAEVAGSPNKAVAWSATAGTIINGVYTVPNGYDYTSQMVRATSLADPRKSVSSWVSITPTGNLDISGTFKKGDYHTALFYQNGTMITGSYRYSEIDFTIEATLNGYSLTGMIRNVADPTATYFLSGTFSEDGQAFTGRNGYQDQHADAFTLTKQPGISMRITPSVPSIHKAGDVIAYVAEVAGSPNKAVSWSASAGSIANGVYVVPSGYDNTAQTITATSAADPTKSVSSQVGITPTGNLDISGTFKDSGYNMALFYQNGTAVTGSYAYSPYGGDYAYATVQFTIEGTLNGCSFTGLVRRVDSPATTYALKGAFSPDGRTFTGTNDYAYGKVISLTKQPGISMRITPSAPSIHKPGDTIAYVAEVAGSPDKAVSWSATAGTVDATGRYTVPAGYDGTMQTVTATAMADGKTQISSQITIDADGLLEVGGVFLDSSGSFFVLVQTGAALVGDWANDHDARLELALDGYEATGTWSSGLSDGVAGPLKLTFSPDRRTFRGQWGYGTGAPIYEFSGTLQPHKVGMVVRPRPLDIRKNAQVQFRAQVVGNPNQGAIWVLQEPLGGSVSGTGLYTAPGTWGNYTLNVIPAVDVTRIRSIPIHVNPPVVVSPATVSVLPLASQSFTAKLTGFMDDRSGVLWSVVESGGGTIDAGGKYTAPDQAGTYTIKATSMEDGNQMGTATVTVPLTVAVAPASASLVAGQSQVFSATVTGDANKAVDWILPDANSGSIAANGTYTAPAVLPLASNTPYQTFKIVARSQADPSRSGYAWVSVYRSLYLSPDDLAASPGGSYILQVGGASVDDRGATWTTTGGGLGPMDWGPLYQIYTAPNQAGVYAVTATSILDPTKKATARILVGVNAPISISPSSLQLRAGTPSKFTAYLDGVASPAVTWSASAGSVASDGTYTAPAQSGTYVLSATSNADPARVATALVTVPLEVVIAPAGATIGSGKAQAYSATVYGSADQSVWWRLPNSAHGSISPSGVFTTLSGLPQGSGGYLYADAKVDPSKSGGTSYIINRPVDISPGTATVPLGAAQYFSATVTGLTGSVAWSASGGTLSASTGSSVMWTAPATAGSYTVTATSTSDPSQKAVATAVVPLQFSIQPRTSVLNLGFSQQYLASVVGSADKGVQWGVVEPIAGAITSQGVYTPGERSGTFHINAIPTADPTKATQATVQVISEVLVDPGYVKVLPGGRQGFRAMIPSAGSQAVTWSVREASGGTITASGDYTAPSVVGTYHVVATPVVEGSTTGGTATVVVMEEAPVRVTVSPGTAETNRLGTVQFSAHVNGTRDQAVTWSASAGTISAGGLFTAPDALGPVTITATSGADSTAKDVAVVQVRARVGTDRTFVYDDNGNLTDDGMRTFEWDVENRLVAVTITATGHRSEFGYDGMGRRVQTRELDLDSNKALQTTSEKKYLWDGVEITEERDSAGANVLRRFYNQGFVDSDGTILFYTRDHLGSIRELTDGTQMVRARYDYDPFGRMTKVQGDRDSAFTYTGHFWHMQSGLNLTFYRAYDANSGRWLSRDPIGMRGGMNLYSYVENNPVNAVDPTGLEKVYGNWCGADWTGGRAEQYSPHEPDYYRPPIDSLDNACADHDICYYKCRKENCLPGNRKNCFMKCDWSLWWQANLSGLMGNPMGFAIANAMLLHVGGD